MLFNSYTFVLFFASVLFLHNLPLPWRLRKVNLLWASYVFYSAWNPPFVMLLWLSTVVDWFMAKAIWNAQDPRKRRLYLIVSLGVNLGLLGFFKYSGFALQSFSAALASVGVIYKPAMPDIVLPIGISFYTFMTLSYALDIYYRKARPCRSFLDYALFVTFFPHLVSGPIVRAAEFTPQLEEPKRATGPQMGWGLSLIVIGLFEKLVIADYLLAPIVDSVYNSGQHPSFVSAWVGTVAFAGQIFCDFSGYSLCAIGAALCLGFAFPDNFHFPYAAVGFSDFWKRWHMSLSRWLRDYLYIPLGGNRKGPVRTHVNIMLTMLLGGLWHGASWTFVIWGGLHGLYQVAERLFKQAVPNRPWAAHGAVRFVLSLVTFALVCFTWVFFRARSWDSAWDISSSMLGLGGAGAALTLPTNIATTAGVMLTLLIVHWRLKDSSYEAVFGRLPWWVRSAALAAMMVLIVLTPGEDRAFIYFQF